MPGSFPNAMLWLLTGLVLGVGGEYFWRSNSQSTSATTQQQTAIETTHDDQQHAAGLAATITAAISNPTGLQLMGTLVQPQHSKSKAWLLPPGSETTQTYGEGDVLPGGYQLLSIGAEDLKVSKDGYSFIIRRSSSSSSPSNNLPCETVAQNSHNVELNKLEQPNYVERHGGLAGSRRKLIFNQIGQGSGQQGIVGPQGNRKLYEGWGSKTIVEEGESAIDPGFLEPPTDNDEPAEKEP